MEVAVGQMVFCSLGCWAAMSTLGNYAIKLQQGDLNIDHRIVCEAVLTACRPVGGYDAERIYAFETPSSTEWNYTYTEPFVPSVYFDISKTLDAKIEGMQCYQSERAAFPHPRSPEALCALAAYRGSNIGVGRAEAFMALREVYR